MNFIFRTPRRTILAGVAGLALGIFMLYYLEYGLSALNESTLVYRQTRWLFFSLVIIVASCLVLVKGIWGAFQDWSSRR